MTDEEFDADEYGYDAEYGDEGDDDDSGEEARWQFEDGFEIEEGRLREFFANEFEAENEATLDQWESLIDEAERALSRPLLWREITSLVQGWEAEGAAGAHRVFDTFADDLSDDDRAQLLADLIDDGSDR